MKLKINTNIIKSLNPCTERLTNYMEHYDDFNGDVSKFVKLDKITHKDKLWVILRLIPNNMKVVFALDCSFAAYAADAAADAAAYAAADAAAYAAADAAADAADAAADAAAYAAAYAAYAADAADADAAARQKEEARQIEALLYLIEGE